MAKKKIRSVAAIDAHMERLRKERIEAKKHEIAEAETARAVEWEKAWNEGEIPEAPAQDPELGEKTPEYLAWLKYFHEEEFETRFPNWKGNS